MRYQRLQDIVRLAVRFQGTLGGLTLGDIEADFAISRRTAERLRDAVDAVFGPLEPVDSADTKRHWRLRSDALRRLVSLSAEELAELDAAALERAGFDERAAALRKLDTKLRATLRADTLARIESDLEALVHVERLAMRAGPKPHIDRGLLALLREAITTRRVVEIHCPVHAAAKPAARGLIRPALRQPRVPGGTDRLERRAPTLALGEHERGPNHRRDLRTQPGL